jgi:hypothetical protein
MTPSPKLELVHGTGVRLFERKMYRLIEDWPIRVSDKTYTVRAGFEFDGASVPTVFKWLLSEAAIMSMAALLHDWLYRTAIVSKEEADAKFRVVLREHDHVRAFDHTVMFLALVACGKRAWKEHRDAGHTEHNYAQ